MSNTASFETKTAAAWGADRPDWIQELAGLADREGLKGAEKRIGYSSATISQVLSNSYRGVLGRVEERVRGALMGFTVDCPVLGEIGRDRCLDEKARPFAATSAMRAQLFRACRSGCPFSRIKQAGADDVH